MDTMVPDDMVLIDLDGMLLEGVNEPPSERCVRALSLWSMLIWVDELRLR